MRVRSQARRATGQPSRLCSGMPGWACLMSWPAGASTVSHVKVRSTPYDSSTGWGRRGFHSGAMAGGRPQVPGCVGRLGWLGRQVGVPASLGADPGGPGAGESRRQADRQAARVQGPPISAASPVTSPGGPRSGRGPGRGPARHPWLRRGVNKGSPDPALKPKSGRPGDEPVNKGPLVHHSSGMIGPEFVWAGVPFTLPLGGTRGGKEEAGDKVRAVRLLA